MKKPRPRPRPVSGGHTNTPKREAPGHSLTPDLQDDDEDDEEEDGDTLQDALDLKTGLALLESGDREYHGLILRPVTLATVAMLMSIKSPLVSGKQIEDVTDILLECGRLLILLSVPVQEARGLCRRLEELDEETYEFLDTLPPTETQNLIAVAMDLLREAMETRVDPILNEKDGKDNTVDTLGEP